jgi:hypothetical protein
VSVRRKRLSEWSNGASQAGLRGSWFCVLQCCTLLAGSTYRFGCVHLVSL